MRLLMRKDNDPVIGYATEQTSKNKGIYKAFLESLTFPNNDRFKSAVKNIFVHDAKLFISHPINESIGYEGYFNDVLSPMMKSFRGLHRREYIIAGSEYNGSEWVSSTGYYAGKFENDWLGIPASGKLAYIRNGEFHKMQDGKIVESYIFLGLAELIIDLGLWPLAEGQGYSGHIPGPATQDGLKIKKVDLARSRETAKMVDDMCKNLATPDQAWAPYWHKNMHWYGPGGLGSYITVEAFGEFQTPFEQTFKGWGRGREDNIFTTKIDCKGGDGDYVYLSGWPALTGIHIKPFLGILPTNKRIYIRDCDWWRCEGDLIVENWCMIDTLHLVYQLGVDVLSELKKNI
jgi:predicted ester cyclase